MVVSTITVPVATLSGRRARPRRRRARRPGGIPPLRGLLPILLLLVVWELVGSASSFSYPTPTTWLIALAELTGEGLWESLAFTLRTFVVGLVLATIAGALGGMILGASRTADRAFTPIADFFRALPAPAVISVVTLIMGPNLSAALVMVILGAMWPILLNTASGLRSIPPLRIETSRTLGLTRLQHLRKILLPSLTPHILLGVKVAASLAFVITLFAEILGVTPGLGLLLAHRQQRFDSAGTWGLLLLIGVCGYLINVVVSLLQRRLLKNWPSQG